MLIRNFRGKTSHRHLFFTFAAVVIIATFVGVININSASAATTLTVDSVLDTQDNNAGDGSCNDGLGNCTLRAALEESNALAGTDTIAFGIGPFNGTVKTILPNTSLPIIVDTVIIDGYTQDDAIPNTAASPNPLNGELRIELDGSNAFDGVGITVQGFVFDVGSANSVVRGMVINSFSGAGITVASDGLVVQGSYLGSDSTGLLRRPNVIAGINSSYNDVRGTDALIGGLDPEDRNLLSGNASSGSYPGTRWTFHGNYIGVDKTGVSALPNSAPGDAGGLSIDFADDVIVGGTSPGATNVISGNGNQGLAPYYADGLVVQGNFIGTDFTGTVAIPNGGIGINLNFSDDVLIGGNSVSARNIISGNNNDAMCIGDSTQVNIQGNYIGVSIDGITDLGNVGAGVTTSCGPNNSEFLVGGTSANEQNIIAFNGTGVVVPNPTDASISILRNSIYANSDLGIDIDVSSQNTNDIGDGDVGANDRLNAAEFTNVDESGGDTTVEYKLDVPSGDYRIEYFSNASLDSSGYGEGETYLGFSNISHPGGGVQLFTDVLTGVTGVTNLSATVTERNVSTNSTFGATSEFGGNAVPAYGTTLTKVLLNPETVAIDQDIVYRLTLKNDGPDDLNLDLLSGSDPTGNFIVLDVLTPELTYVSENSSDVTCTDIAPASIFGSVLGNHPTFRLISCAYTGPSRELEVGESFSFNMTVHVTPSSDLHFINYALTPVAPGDEDYAEFSSVLFSGNDIIDELSGRIGNLTYAQFPLPIVTTPTTIPAPAPGVSGSLPATGMSLVALFGFSLAIASLGCLIGIRAKRYNRVRNES